MDKDAQLGEGHFISGQGLGICRLRAGSHNGPGQGWLFCVTSCTPEIPDIPASSWLKGRGRDNISLWPNYPEAAGATEEADYLGR